MGLRKLLTKLFDFSSTAGKHRRKLLAADGAIESLEPRLVLYAASGNAWPSPELVTISFVPDGTNLGGVSSNLNSSFNANGGLTGWQTEILRAAQVWAQQTNVNLSVVSDNGAATGSGNYQQGASTFGDIRIGGYDFGDSSLAAAYMPPPVNNYSIAGDIVFNTATTFSIGSGYDLFTVATHEFGHALGLNHSTATSSAEMWATYTGVKPNLNSDDISGIRSIYSGGAARSADRFETGGGNNSFASATDITGDLVRLKKWAIENDLDITTTSDVDYFKFTVPNWADTDIAITATSLGLSQLSQKITVYAANQTTVLGTKTATTNGANLWVPIYGTAKNDVIYIKVESAVTTAFGTGAYGLTLDLGGVQFPSVTIPDTTLANGSPLHSGGGQADSVDVFGSGTGVVVEIPTLEITGANSKTPAVGGIAVPASTITIYNNGVAIGTTTASASGQWNFGLAGKLSTRVNSLTASATDSEGNSSIRSAAQVLTLPLRRIRHGH